MTMSEQTKISFTRGVQGDTYLSEEVDNYLQMLHGAYEDMEKELKSLESKTVDENEIKKFYESQIEAFKNQINKGLEAKAADEREKSRLKEEADRYLKSIEELQEASSEHLKTIAKLREAKNEVQNTDKLEEFYQEKVEKLESLLVLAQEEVGDLQREKVALEEAKERLEEKQLESTNDGRVKAYSELIERTIDATQDYVDDIKTQMNSMANESKTRQEKALHQANVNAFNMIREAKNEADGLVESAKKKSQEILGEAKQEYSELRELIKKASREYVAIVTLPRQDKLLDATKEQSQALQEKVIKVEEE